MRAIYSIKSGGPNSLCLTEGIAVPKPGPGEVRIRVKAVGLNYPDLLIIEDNYQFKPERPFAPGGELTGVVSEVGDGVTYLKLGDRVSAITLWGALIDEVVASADCCVKLPDSVDFSTAAALTMAYGTAYYALKIRGNLKAGETLLVLGATGGVGLAAVELGKSMGARVIAAASSTDKLNYAQAAGADDGIVYPTGDMGKDGIKALSKSIKEVSGGGVDVTIDPIGGDYAHAAVRCMNWGGRHLVVGFVAGIPHLPLNLVLLKSCDIRGIFWGPAAQRDPAEHRQSTSELFAFLEAGQISPHIHASFPLEETAQALELLASRTVLGKVVVTLD